MSTKLVEHLKKMTADNANVNILLAQWEFDRKLVGKALEGIVSYFPHFSSHNASHSEQILINIERILGDSINGLSATDTWLLLESAYWHDIGMLIDSKSAISSIESDDFSLFVTKIAKNSAHDLYTFAKSYDEEDWLFAFKQEQTPFAAMEKFRQLLAEWFRVKHPDRAQQIVNDPFVELGINSPRTELLPKRLYRYLGQICLAHGRSFEFVMKGLPHKQTGLGTEDCHPRFIACMLRLGDLFDLDDNRFCPVMQKQVGKMPKFSQTHQHKHLALREFLLDRETIKIVAECPDENSYIETQNWFTWIRQEIQQQMADWKLIVPNRNFGLLPTIELLDIKLKEGRILLDNKPMRFGLDEENIFELLKGDNIYKSNTSVYRELIQNAIDATMMRVWLERGSESNSTNKLPKNAHPFETRTQKILAEYPITIDFKKVRDDENSDDAIWEFSITDQGVGISENDLKYIQQLAGSNQNEARQKIIKKMPGWMRPSGAFGIGMHSAFLLTEKTPDDQCIYLETKNIFSHKRLEVELHSPVSAKQGFCFIKPKILDSDFGNYGTTLRVKTRVTRRGKYQYKDNYNENKYKITKLLNDHFDPLFQVPFDHIKIANIIDKIMYEIMQNIPIPITLLFNGKEIYDSNPTKKWQQDALWSEKHQLYLKINMDTYLSCSRFNSIAYFKGQTVKEDTAPFQFHYFHFKIDVHGTDAKKALTVDRSDWQKEYHPQFEKEIVNTIHDGLSEDHNKIKIMLDNNDSIFSFFIHTVDIENKHPEFHNDEWKKHKFTKNLSIGELLKKPSFTIINDYESGKYEESKDIFIIKNGNPYGLIFLQKKWYEGENRTVIVNSILQYSKKYFFTKGNSDNSEYNHLTNWLNNHNPYYYVEDCEVDKKDGFYQEFKPLSCMSPMHKDIIGVGTEKILLLPFLRTGLHDNLAISTHNVEKIAIETWKSRDDKYQDETQAKYISLYEQLIKKIDNLMKDYRVWNAARERGKKYQCPAEIQTLLDRN